MELFPVEKVLSWFFDHYGAVCTLMLGAVWYLIRQLQTEQKESGELKKRMVENQDKANDIQIAGVRLLARIEAKLDQLLEGARNESR